MLYSQSKNLYTLSAFKTILMIRQLFCILCLPIMVVNAQSIYTPTDEDAFFIRDIYTTALNDQYGYNWLRDMTENIGPRLSGSEGAAQAVYFVKQHMEALGADTVILQEVPNVPRWQRGETETVRFVDAPIWGNSELSALSLGNSIGTPEGGIEAQVVEVHEIDHLDSLGRLRLEGKIVFFNRPFDNSQISPSSAYGGAVDQRVYGPTRAAEYGAVAVVVRSMTGRLDDVPHTGVTQYIEDTIPGIAISTLAANRLAQALDEGPTRLFIEMDCQNLTPVTSYNVIADWNGTDSTAPYILLGGHLDSWDVGTGAHDDGSGCAHITDVVHILKTLGYEHRHPLRLVFYMNEENGLQGARVYARKAEESQTRHSLAIESDSGGFLPLGFRCDGIPETLTPGFKQLHAFSDVFSPYRIDFASGGSGADIGRLKSQGPLLVGFRTSPQRYFDLHHTDRDVFERVHPRELELGSAAIAALVYLWDQRLKD
jgi:hypothetical protein